MEINITINDSDLEARLIEHYNLAKIEGETFEIFCGRVILAQMVNNEIRIAYEGQQNALQSALKQSQKELAEDGEITLKKWTEQAISSEKKLA